MTSSESIKAAIKAALEGSELGGYSPADVVRDATEAIGEYLEMWPNTQFEYDAADASIGRSLAWGAMQAAEESVDEFLRLAGG